MARLPTITLPPELYSPSFLGGEGVNYGIPRQGKPILQLQTAQNVWASNLGIGSETEFAEGLGVGKKNDSRPVTAKVQALIPFGTDLLQIANGNVYLLPQNGGTPTLIQASVFDANGKIYYQYGRGGSPKVNKVYICDSSELYNPYTWDGTTLAEYTQFNSAILGLSLPKPVLMMSQHGSFDERVTFGFGQNTEYKNALLHTQRDNGDNVTSTGSIIGAYLDYVDPMSDGYITGFNITTASEQAQEIATTLYVAKSNGQTFRTGTPKLVGSEVVSDFGLTGVNLGTINGDTMIAFSNDLISVDKNGIGGFSFATSSGNVEALSNQLGARVNPLIQASANLKADELTRGAFAVHCVDRQVIWLFFPSSTSSISLNGWSYPEAPSDLCIQYQYSVVNKEGGISAFWSIRKNEGWAWSCACVVGKRVFLGSYFGDVYELFIGDKAEPNPADPSTDIAIESIIETGDWDLGDLTKYKKFNQLWFNFNLIGSIQFDLTVYYNSSETGKTYSGLGQLVQIARWDVAQWDVDQWAGLSSLDLRGTPKGGGKLVRLKIKMKSLVDGVSNRACLYGLSAILELGDNALKYRK